MYLKTREIYCSPGLCFHFFFSLKSGATVSGDLLPIFATAFRPLGWRVALAVPHKKVGPGNISLGAA